LFATYRVRKVLALFPQNLVTSGGNEMQEKDELYRRPGALVSNKNLDFVDQVPSGAADLARWLPRTCLSPSGREPLRIYRHKPSLPPQRGGDGMSCLVLGREPSG
jgi:hypothetical protein